MVDRIEISLILLIALFVAVSGTGDIRNSQKSGSEKGDDIVIEGAKLVEVNSSSVIDEMNASVARERERVWYFEDFSMSGEEVERVGARKARRSEKEIEMYGDVNMTAGDGSRYHAEDIVYLPEKSIFYSKGPFSAVRGESLVRGEDFHYNISTNTTRASGVFGSFEMAQRRREPGSNKGTK